MSPCRFLRSMPLGIMLGLLAAPEVWSAEVTVAEHEVKAAFLFNFTRFVEWPPRVFAGPSAPVVLGVLAEGPIAEVLPEIVRGQVVQGRSVEVRRLQGVEETETCHVVFVEAGHEARIDAVLRAVRGRPILTVSDADDFARRGGMIGYVTVGKSVRFDVNQRAAVAADLRISSKLLALARNTITR